MPSALDRFVKRYASILQIEENIMRDIMKNIPEKEYEKIADEINQMIILRHS